MTSLSLTFGHPGYPDIEINDSIKDILQKNNLMSMASIKLENNEIKSWINTAYYSYSTSLAVYHLSEPTTEHSRNIHQNPSVAIAIFDSHQESPSKKQGLQLFGQCQLATGAELAEGTRLYIQRYPAFGSIIKGIEDWDRNLIHSKLYVTRISQVKIFDEPRFGSEVWVTVEPTAHT
jgi:hypothetical protein